MNKFFGEKTSFWNVQFAGWGLYGLVYFVHMILFREVKSMDIIRVLLVLFMGFFISSLMRKVYFRIRLKSCSILSLILLSILCSFCAANVWVWGFRITWSLVAEGWDNWHQILKVPFVKTLASLFFDTLLLTSWSALYFTIKFWRAWNDQKKQARLLRLKAQRAQLQMLHYQMNPHFLFNVMNSIRALIGENKQQAKQMITELSEFLRYSLVSKENSIVPLQYEIEALHHFFSIEKRRYENKLEVQFDIEPAALSCPVVSFILYPIAENALKYGLQTSRMPLKIVVQASVSEESVLQLRISNTGVWIPPQDGHDNGHMHGLSMVRHQLKSIYPNAHNLTIDGKEGRVVINIEINQSSKSIHAKNLQCIDRG